MKRAVVVLDAVDWLGRAVVQAAVEANRAVIAVASDPIALKDLKATHPGADLTLVRGSISDDRESAALATSLRALDRPLAGIVIARCTEPARGRVLDQSTEALRQVLEHELLPQLAAARALVPLLAQAGRNGSYVVIGGPGGESPWAGYGRRSIAAAATRMLLRVLHDEAHALSVRVQLLAVEMPARTDENRERACAHWPTAVAIGQRALELIDQTDTREPAQAVVRYAWNAVPPLPTQRPARVTEIASTQEMQSPAQIAASPSVPTTAAARTARAPKNPAPMPNLDDTWALLKPLLTSNNK